MNATELKAALNTVEQDHELVFEKVKGLKETVGLLLEPDTDYHAALERLRELNRFFATVFETHLQEEEVTLFPLLEKYHPEGGATVKQLQKDHEDIRNRLEEFDKCLYVASETEEQPQRMVMRDLLSDGWELWAVLDDHARVETDAVRECLTRFWGGDAPAAS